MKYVSAVAGALLGLLFIASGVVVLFKLTSMPVLPEGTPAGHFNAAFGPTGYMTFVKVLEVVGGILIAIPRTRRLGLLVLGPIIVNIFAYHLFVMKGEGLLDAPLLILFFLAAFLLWSERKAFLTLILGSHPPDAKSSH